MDKSSSTMPRTRHALLLGVAALAAAGLGGCVSADDSLDAEGVGPPMTVAQALLGGVGPSRDASPATNRTPPPGPPAPSRQDRR